MGFVVLVAAVDDYILYLDVFNYIKYYLMVIL